MKFYQTVVRFAAFAALVVPALFGYAADSSGAHLFVRRDNGTNIVSRLVPDGTGVATNVLTTVIQMLGGSVPSGT